MDPSFHFYGSNSASPIFDQNNTFNDFLNGDWDPTSNEENTFFSEVESKDTILQSLTQRNQELCKENQELCKANLELSKDKQELYAQFKQLMVINQQLSHRIQCLEIQAHTCAIEKEAESLGVETITHVFEKSQAKQIKTDTKRRKSNPDNPVPIKNHRIVSVPELFKLKPSKNSNEFRYNQASAIAIPINSQPLSITGRRVQSAPDVLAFMQLEQFTYFPQTQAPGSNISVAPLISHPFVSHGSHELELEKPFLLDESDDQYLFNFFKDKNPNFYQKTLEAYQNNEFDLASSYLEQYITFEKFNAKFFIPDQNALRFKAFICIKKKEFSTAINLLEQIELHHRKNNIDPYIIQLLIRLFNANYLPKKEVDQKIISLISKYDNLKNYVTVTFLCDQLINDAQTSTNILEIATYKRGLAYLEQSKARYDSLLFNQNGPNHFYSNQEEKLKYQKEGLQFVKNSLRDLMFCQKNNQLHVNDSILLCKKL